MSGEVKVTFRHLATSDTWVACAHGVPKCGTVSAEGKTPEGAFSALRSTLKRVLAFVENPPPQPPSTTLDLSSL